jgi:hypothetical protein
MTVTHVGELTHPGNAALADPLCALRKEGRNL